jgi:hypothetical protein
MKSSSRNSTISRIKYESERITACEKTCHSCRVLYLHIINAVDIGLGISLLAFTVYLFDILGSKFSDEQAAWVGWCTGSLGLLLFGTAMLSLMASLTPGCRCAIIPSNYLSLITFLYSLALAIISLVKKGNFFDYIEDAGLDENQTNTVKSWYSVISFSLLGVAVIQLIRIILSLSFREHALRIDNDFKVSLLEDQRIYEEKSSTSKVEKGEKYRNLKEYYRAKYNSSNPNSPYAS